MESAATTLLTQHPWVARRPFTVAEYHRMGDAGILTEDDRVELIEWQLIAMSPIGSDYSGTINGLNRMLVMAVGDRGVVAVQNPVQLEAGEVEVCRQPQGDRYASVMQAGRDVVLEPELLPGVAISVAVLLG